MCLSSTQYRLGRLTAYAGVGMSVNEVPTIVLLAVDGRNPHCNIACLRLAADLRVSALDGHDIGHVALDHLCDDLSGGADELLGAGAALVAGGGIGEAIATVGWLRRLREWNREERGRQASEAVRCQPGRGVNMGRFERYRVASAFLLAGLCLYPSRRRPGTTSPSRGPWSSGWSAPRSL
jgi:hypothetical protein